MRNAFLVEGRPTLVAMLKTGNLESTLREIELILEQGTDAFGFQIDLFEPSERTRENFAKVFAAMKGKPVYITNYVNNNPVQHTDEELVEELMVAAECGGTMLIDIRGDLFDRSPMEYSTDPVAVQKQKDVIAKFKSLGAEVIMSIHAGCHLPVEKVLEMAAAEEERGADVLKIVTTSYSEEEQINCFGITAALKKAVHKPMLYLCSGSHCKMHRILTPAVDCSLMLVVENSREGENQPTLKRAKEVLTLAGYQSLP